MKKINVEEEAEDLLGEIDSRGDMKRCTLSQWIEFLEILSVEVNCRYEAAKEDKKARGNV